MHFYQKTLLFGFYFNGREWIGLFLIDLLAEPHSFVPWISFEARLFILLLQKLVDLEWIIRRNDTRLALNV